MRCPTAALVLLAVAAPAAGAKGVLSAQVCGADGCRTIDRPPVSLLGERDSTARPAPGTPFVRLRVVVGVPGRSETLRLRFFPGPGVVKVSDPRRVYAQAYDVAAMRKVAALVTPFGQERRAPAVATRDEAGLSWWIALLAAPLAGAALLARRRLRGTDDRPEVYGLSGAPHGRGPGRPSARR